MNKQTTEPKNSGRESAGKN